MKLALISFLYSSIFVTASILLIFLVNAIKSIWNITEFTGLVWKVLDIARRGILTLSLICMFVSLVWLSFSAIQFYLI